MSLIYKYIKGNISNASVTSKDVDTSTRLATSKVDDDNFIKSSNSRNMKWKVPPMVHQPHRQFTLEDSSVERIGATTVTQCRLVPLCQPISKQDLFNKVSEHSIPPDNSSLKAGDEWQISEEQIEREMENYLGTTNEHEWPWSFKSPLPDASSLVRAFEEEEELFNINHRCKKQP